MKDKINIINLYDCYSNLFTDKQIMYFEDYYFEDLSLSEIAENYNISRAAAHKQIKDVVSKLNDYESKLKILEKKEKIIKLLKEKDIKIKEEIEEILK